MKITVKKFSQYPDVKITHDSTTIELGMLDASERDELSREFVDAMWAMGPSNNDECAEWLFGIISACGIDMPNVRGQGTRHLVAGTLDPFVGLRFECYFRFRHMGIAN